MESKTNKTIFQNLGRIFDITPNTLKPTSEPIPFDKEPQKGLLASASKEEIDIFKLQGKQQTHLDSQFLRLVSDQKEKTLGYESSRLQQYFDYETMDAYPVISAALDLLCEESTTIGQNGKMLNIFSTNKTIKRELERLFEKVIDINIALPPWARNLCKYGDNFIYLIMEQNKGIVGTRQLPNIEIDRIEEEIDGKIRVKFINKQKRSEEYNTWQIGHFRLLGDDRRMPYGMSMLDKVRRTYKMLSMAEDAMLVYRITRAAERRVVKVNVGNAPAEDIPMMLQAAAAQFHGKSPLTDRQTGDINFKYSIATNDSDIFIPVRTDNATNPIETLQGASNLNDINDISYLRSNLFTGLGIPKSFLSFSSDDPNEKGGANLSMLDIRFSRKINRVQQALISELNKIAIVHLYTLGGEYAKNIDNFKLTLANPSTQAEMLKIEELSAKLDVYAKAVTAVDGIKPMSQAEAMIKILGKSHDEVLETLQDQIVETKVGAEIVSGDQLLKNSKMFNKLIKYYNAGIIPNPNSQETETENQGGDNNEMNDAPNLDDLPSDTLKENKSLLYENQQMIKDLEKMMEDVALFQNKINKK